MWAVVPLKSPEAAKSRLSGVLSAAERVRLFTVMARQVLTALAATPGIERVAVVTASDAVMALAPSCGAEPIRVSADHGTARACEQAVTQLRPRGIASVLLIAGDLPLISPAALAPLIELARAAPVAAVVPDRFRRGTNALLCAPPDLVSVCFGPGSFERHCAAARQAGVSLRVVESEALGLDIDDPHDLEELRRRINLGAHGIPEDLRVLLRRQEEVIAS